MAISTKRANDNTLRSVNSVSISTSNFAYRFVFLANKIDAIALDSVVAERKYGPVYIVRFVNV